MFARTGVTSGKTATTETKLTRVGEGGKETRRFFISLEELRKLSSDQDWEKLFFASVSKLLNFRIEIRNSPKLLCASF